MTGDNTTVEAQRSTLFMNIQSILTVVFQIRDLFRVCVLS
jgi:hypothetical protein